MADRLLTCPLCGFEFDREDTLCQHGCPLRSGCNLSRCPMCDYEFPPQPRALERLTGLFRRRRKPPAADPDRLVTLKDLASGEEARVLHLAEGDAERSNTLSVFGLVPGSRITLIQRQPSFVLQVGETVLALDADVAGSIVVERPSAA